MTVPISIDAETREILDWTRHSEIVVAAFLDLWEVASPEACRQTGFAVDRDTASHRVTIRRSGDLSARVALVEEALPAVFTVSWVRSVADLRAIEHALWVLQQEVGHGG